MERSRDDALHQWLCFALSKHTTHAVRNGRGKNGKRRRVLHSSRICLEKEALARTYPTNTKRERTRTIAHPPLSVFPDSAGTRGSSCLYISRSSFEDTPFPSCPSPSSGSPSRTRESTSPRPYRRFYAVRGSKGTNIAMSFASIRFILLSISAWSAALKGVRFIRFANKHCLYAQ